MSQADVEIVRRATEPYEGQNVVALAREWVEQLGPEYEPDAVLARWADDPAMQCMHTDVEYDATALGVSAVARGPREVAMWWVDWLEVWDSCTYRLMGYRDLGDWVLAPVGVRARGREGVPVEMRSFELYQVRDGKIVAYRVFLSEREALEAVGLAEEPR